MLGSSAYFLCVMFESEMETVVRETKETSSEKRWRSQLRILSLDGESWCPTQDGELWCCHLVPFLPWVARQVMSVAVEIYSIWTEMWSEAKWKVQKSTQRNSWADAMYNLCVRYFESAKRNNNIMENNWECLSLGRPVRPPSRCSAWQCAVEEHWETCCSSRLGRAYDDSTQRAVLCGDTE